MFPTISVPGTSVPVVVVPALPVEADRIDQPAPRKLKTKAKATAAPITKSPPHAPASSADPPTPSDSVDQPAPQQPKKQQNARNEKAAPVSKPARRTQKSPRPAPVSSVDPPKPLPANASSTPPAPRPLPARTIVRAVPSNLPNLNADSPLRPADWRWQLACVLAGHPEAPRYFFEDPLVVAACTFIRARETSPAAPVAPEWQPLATALELYRSDAMNRAVLEARILAKEDTPTIARKCDLDAAAIDTYHDVFFDVRGLLGCYSRIDWMVLHTASLVESDQPRLLKLFAYTNGPAVLDYLLLRYIGKPKPVIPVSFAGLSRQEIEELRHWIEIRVRILLEFYRPRNESERMRLVELRLLHPYYRQSR